ncbi:MAG: hypothetical protein D6B25_14070, partial [Desulfobulbaceae bacterium]
ISVSAFGLFLSRGFTEAKQQLQEHILTGLPKMVNELVLFLGAGVLALGLQTLVSAGHLSLSFTQVYDGTTATILLGAMILVAVLGVHPVISIAVATPLIAPLNPHPQLLALTFVFSWSLGACASPLSGLNLIFQGRYAIPSAKLAVANWPYVLTMYPIAALFLYGAAALLDI